MAETETQPADTAPAGTPSWRDALPEDLKTDKTLAETPDVATLARRFLDTKKMVGAKSAIPGPDAKPEEVAAFHAALGVPKTPAEYKVKAHEMMAHPEWNREAQDAFVKLAHAQGFTPAQVDTAIQFYANFIGGQVKANATVENEAKAELRQEWGVNFDTFLGAANRGVSRMEKMLSLEPGTLVEATKGSNPAAITKLFHAIESQFVEHGFVQGEPITGVSAADAASQIQSLKADLLKVPEGSEQALALINKIAMLGRALTPRAA